MNHLDLFSGIGGFALGLERAGFKTVGFCEIEKYPRKILEKHWPAVKIYGDIRDVTKEGLRADGIVPDIITGGFPCQDISQAGRQAGISGDRSGLWSELHRIIGEVQPKYAVMENVTNLIAGDRGRWFGRVLGDLAEIGYDAEWHCIPASYAGRQTLRDRIWIVAYPNGKGLEGCWEYIKRARKWPTRESVEEQVWFQSAARNGRVAARIPDRSHRIKGVGNSVAPDIVEIIGNAIKGIENGNI